MTIPPLVAKNVVAWLEVFDFPADLNDLAGEFVSQDLRLDLQRNGTALRVEVIVAMAAIQVKVRPADSHGFDA